MHADAGTTLSENFIVYIPGFYRSLINKVDAEVSQGETTIFRPTN